MTRLIPLSVEYFPCHAQVIRVSRAVREQRRMRVTGTVLTIKICLVSLATNNVNLRTSVCVSDVDVVLQSLCAACRNRSKPDQQSDGMTNCSA